MIQQKPKKCKGTGKALGYGCGDKLFLHKFGLCQKCFKEWLFSNDGLPYLNSTQIRAKKYVQKEQNKELAIKKEETRQKKIDLMSSDRYRAKYVQPVFNKIARLIDYGQPCIVTGYYDGVMNGGHFISVGNNRTLSLNLHNIHIQSYESNGPKGGDNQLYRQGLIDTYGIEYLEKIEALRSIPALKLSKSELVHFRSIAIKIANELKSNPIIRTPEERIALRESINKKIGIYQ